MGPGGLPAILYDWETANAPVHLGKFEDNPRPQRDQILSIPGLKKVSMTVAAKMKKQFCYKKTFRGHLKKTTITNQELWILQVLHLALEVEIEKWD
jgi:hypothetical protein